MPERSAEQIQAQIESSRVALAKAVDELAARTNPKTKLDELKQSLRTKAQTPAGKAVIGGAGALVAIVIIRRIRRH